MYVYIPGNLISYFYFQKNVDIVLKLTKLTTFSFSADLESKQITKRLHNQYIDHTYFTKLFFIATQSIQ